MPPENSASRKLKPWLRVIANGARSVNAARSDGSARVACATPVGVDGLDTALIYRDFGNRIDLLPPVLAGLDLSMVQASTVQASTVQASTVQASTLWTASTRIRLTPANRADDSFVNVLIEVYPGSFTETEQDAATRVEDKIDSHNAARGARVGKQTLKRRNLVCATVSVEDLDTLAEDPAVTFIDSFEPLSLDRPIVLYRRGKQEPPRPKAISSGDVEIGKGEGVLIGIIDVGGFDFAHSDFIENDETRFVAIWDQGGVFRDPPSNFSRGSEFRQEHLNAAIKAAGKSGLPRAVLIEPQSQMHEGSHGTHVASIAAGNSGVCPGAKIAAVLVDIPQIGDAVDRRRSTFSDASSILHAVEYLLQVAKEQDLPLSINISLGTNGGSHDGAGSVSRWLDAYLARPGRSICMAAGNSGQERAVGDDDIGWIMGRIHTSGRIPARGLEVEIEWTVVGDGIVDVSDNELEIWYGAQDRFVVALKPPGSSEWLEVKPGEYVENFRAENSGGVHVSIYNELYHPVSGGNYISMYLTPDLEATPVIGIPRGIWRVRLYGEEIRDGRFDAWIERDDPMEISREGQRRVFRFPSFFSETSNVDSHSITSLACGQSVIAVANLDAERDRINVTSSQGPTRDGRNKPEIAAPGTDILAANGFGTDDEPWIAMTGTSMASPYVTGVLGLMLEANPALTAAQCLGILQRTARPLAGASYSWVNDVGFGKVDPRAALQEALVINGRVDIGRQYEAHDLSIRRRRLPSLEGRVRPSDAL